MKINGEEIKIEENMTIRQVLEQQNFRTDKVAVELNGEICSKSKFDSVIVKDNDKMEVVSFVGGG